MRDVYIYDAIRSPRARAKPEGGLHDLDAVRPSEALAYARAEEKAKKKEAKKRPLCVLRGRCSVLLGADRSVHGAGHRCADERRGDLLALDRGAAEREPERTRRELLRLLGLTI